MKLPKIGRLGPSLKKIILALKGFRRFFSRIEKVTIVVLLSAALISLVFWVKEVRSQGNNTSAIYTEGWLVDNSSVLPSLGRLTSAGLTRYAQDGSIAPDIADKWEESDDHLTYSFHIRDGFSLATLLQNIEQNKEVFGDTEVSIADDSTLVFKLKQPLNFFMATTTKAIFPFGPYAIEDQTAQNISLVLRREYHLDKPHIKKIVIRLYTNEDALRKALKAGKVMATADLNSEVEGMNTQRVSLPRFVSVFFNIRNEPLNNKDIREKIINGENVEDLHLKLRLVTTTAPEVASELDSVTDKLESQGIKLEVTKLDTGTLVSNVLPDRDFDLLLFGIDYGYGEDLYPFWHSSRVDSPGSNFVGLQNKDLDFILEEARTTSDMDTRKEKIEEAKEIIKNEYVELPVKAKVMLYQASPRVQNNKLGTLADPLDRFNFISDWTIS